MAKKRASKVREDMAETARRVFLVALMFALFGASLVSRSVRRTVIHYCQPPSVEVGRSVVNEPSCFPNSAQQHRRSTNR